ncbi:MAG: hypothetical protein RIF41_16375 [Polyangiaceae bacterium]
MRVVLTRITGDTRPDPSIAAGETAVAMVELEVNGTPRTFKVLRQAHVIQPADVGILHGDQLLEELLRFEPVALSRICLAVAAASRGEHVDLPLTLPTRALSAAHGSVGSG